MKRENIGFVPWAAAYMGFCPGTSEESQLKVVTLYYDKVILPVGAGQLRGIVDTFVNGEGISEKEIAKVWYPVDKFAGGSDPEALLRQLFIPDRANCWDSKGNIRRGLRGAVDEAVAESLRMSSYELKKLKKENWYGYVRETNALAVTSTGSARLWTILRQQVPCALVGFYRAEIIAAEHVLTTAPRTRATLFRDEVQAFVPSVRDLPWEAVFALRKDKRVSAFRSWLSAHTGLVGGTDNSKRVLDSLWSAIDDLAVNVKTEVIKGIVSNIPLPIPVNPVGIATSVKTIGDARKFEKKYDWLLFLHSIKKAAEV